MAIPLHLELLPGTLLALRYRVGEVLGRGGMGTVYRAHHLLLDREVALKVVPPGVGDAAATIRFEREARNSARLDHPGCVRVLDVGTTPTGQRFLAMDLLEGPTLRDAIKTGARMRVEPALRIASAMLDALDHAHRRGVIHRDIKPENVMLVGRDGRPVVIDFGLSWALGDARVTRAGTTVGSPSYLAPERALGSDGDARVDVYAVGVILYEMLAGKRPFAAATAVQLAWLQAHGDAPPLPSVAPGVPLAVAALVHRALAKDPLARWLDAAAMREAIEACLGAPAAAAAPVRPPAITPATSAASTAEPSEDESTTLVISPRSRLRDLVGRLWHGRWRWRPA